MLLETSLVVKDLESDNFKVQNFIMKYVEFKLRENEYTKIKYNRMLATFYCDIINRMKKDVSDEIKELEDLYKLNEQYEKNFLLCLDFLISLLESKSPEIKQKSTIKSELVFANSYTKGSTFITKSSSK